MAMNDVAATAGEPSASATLAARRRPFAARLGHWVVTLLPGIALLAFWQWASGRLIKEIYVSKPTAVAARLYELFASGEIYPHLWTTGQELVLGYVIGVAGGVLGGYALGRSPRLAAIFEPYVMAFYGIPKIALAPLFIIWFGIGIGSKVALAAIMVFFLVFYNVYTGVRGVDRELVNLTLVMGANQRQLTRHVYFPAAAPYVLLGMRMAVPYSVIGVIVGEFTSSISGLGLFIHEASSTYDPAGVFAGIVILLAFVVVANLLAGRLERRLLRWKTPMGHAPSDI
jgi:NitT/TauT family transport system permease protein